ncbi:rho GTPase-activating protein 68F [Eurosta solidaginis]|uniref:rho GTPase-activating protein 68F n=1 Tax=Eurosta solidaginis TaxID=178769 RepID=UPI0035314E0D
MDSTLRNAHIKSRLPGPSINTVVENSEEPQPSLSDLHDFEPKLEFDDTELLAPATLPKDVIVDDFVLAEDEYIESADIVNTLEDEDDFEDQLREEQAESIVSVRTKCDFLGTDKQGRHIFAIYASRFPEKSQMEKFISDVIKEIEPFVENDYILVYFHQGLQEHSKPSAQLLWNSYKELDRNFRKNLKNLYVVHPTLFIRFIWKFFSPFISEKFRQKLVYISSLDELRQALGLSKIKVPDSICDFDEQLNVRNKASSGPFGYGGYGSGSSSSSGSSTSNATKQMAITVQFGAPLKFIVSNSPCLNSIPPIVRKCVDLLSMTGMIDTEGIFRRSGNHTEIIALKERVNRGEDVDLSKVNVHVIAGLLKSFLRDLSEPLLTFELYDDITSFLDWPKEERSRNVTQLIREKLPEENYELFKYLVEFLVRVMECEDLNKMTSSNLAIVFGPNFLWSNRNTSLEDIRPINAFIDFVLQNHKGIYLIDVNQRIVPIG